MEQKRKYKFIYLFIYLFIIIGCKRKITKTISIKKDSIDFPLITQKKNISLEYILLDSILINNKFPFKGEIDILNKIIKKPDSLNYFGYECGSELNMKNQIIYYKKSEIEVSKNLYVFRIVNFSSSYISLRYKNIIFSKDYDIDNFKKDFPKSFLNNRDMIANKVEIFVASTLSEDYDVSWRFTFIQGKLNKIFYFIPC